ncbi:MAG TPA: carbohydrate ABC transporter permease [Thermodesulfobacteriota bacterium]|nr:carbohydrate ABC transporter permease [Thermodesulfobacteriota bacterium]
MDPRTRQNLIEFLKHAVMILICAVALSPILWIGTQAFKSYFDTIAVPPKVFFTPVLENFRQVLVKPGFLASIWDSFIMAAGSSILGLLLGTPCGYALARLRYRGSEGVGFFLLITRMVSPIVIIIPLNRAFQFFGLIDTHVGLILAHTFINIGLVVWMMRGFFQDIPDSLEEAARLDGCSNIQAFYRVALPTTAPGLAATTIFCFLFSWNELMMALTLTSLQVRTTPVFIISEFVGYLAVEWGLLSAAGILIVLPMLIFVVAIQKNLVRGLTMGAVK